MSIPILFLGVALFADTVNRGGVSAVYASFFAALMIWGWIEMAFLGGVITGPNRFATPPDVPEWERFVRAWGAVAYHEILLLTALVALGLTAIGALNPFGFWIFAVLFGARISAKLNLFYGVPRINTEFLPRPLAHLPTHFRVRRMTWFFPFSVTALAFTTGCFLERVAGANTPAERVGFALVAAMAALALLEHWLMVVPLPDAKLWRWLLPDAETRPQETQEKTIARRPRHGFLTASFRRPSTGCGPKGTTGSSPNWNADAVSIPRRDWPGPDPIV